MPQEQKSRTILVVEDEAPLQEAIQIKLAQKGVRYLPAMNAEEALVMLEKDRPDLIWLDLLMPGMGGLGFLEEIRKHPECRDIPVVIVSVSGGPDKIKKAFGFNVVDYLVKSEYKLEELVGRVLNLLNGMKVNPAT